ncbi:hypothetical protein FBY31_2320 [Arthrobacter sp. SLBN-100]|nr:hypothetical protein FBY31_2320 [Arthrobacter sp. SLBN-100]
MRYPSGSIKARIRLFSWVESLKQLLVPAGNQAARADNYRRMHP